MGLSSLWYSIKGSRTNKSATETHHDNFHVRHHQLTPANANGALKDSNAQWDRPSKIDRTTSKKSKRRSFWRTDDSEAVLNEEPMPLLPSTQKETSQRNVGRSGPQLNVDTSSTAQKAAASTNAAEDKKAKRRSLWRSQPRANVPDQSYPTDTIPSSTQTATDKKAKRRSFWRSETQTNIPAIPRAAGSEQPTSPTQKETTTTRRASRPLSTASRRPGKSPRKRLSIFGGGPDIDSDDDVPTMPAISANRLHEQQRDQGRFLGLPSTPPEVPDTATTSENNPNVAANSPTKSEKRQSHRTSLLRQISSTSEKPSDAVNQRRRSWLSSSSSRRNSTIPPVRALPPLTPDSQTSSTDPFENFLLNSHRYSRHASQPYHDLTDYERFLKETAEFEALGLRAQPMRTTSDIYNTLPKSATDAAAAAAPTKKGYRGSYLGPRNAHKSFMETSTDSQTKRRSWRKSYAGHEAPAKRGSGVVCLSSQQQEDWDKLKVALENMESREEDGVMGMLRELDEDDSDSEEWGWRSGHGGQGVYQNQDALTALEYGAAR